LLELWLKNFLESAPSKVEAETIAKIVLPKPKRKLSGTRRNKLADFINASAVAPVGDRSGPGKFL
jgi:hypothetical protein